MKKKVQLNRKINESELKEVGYKCNVLCKGEEEASFDRFVVVGFKDESDGTQMTALAVADIMELAKATKAMQDTLKRALSEVDTYTMMQVAMTLMEDDTDV